MTDRATYEAPHVSRPSVITREAVSRTGQRMNLYCHATINLRSNERMTNLSSLGLIGNCQSSALIDSRGAVVWSCLPRFDSPPVFGSLLDPDGGEWVVGPADGSEGVMRYLGNTNVLETTFDAPSGRFRVRDFMPRFEQHSRMFRPPLIVRQLEPLSGTPRVSVQCRPVRGWSKTRPVETVGSHHVRFEGFASELRLTTDIPLSYLDGQAFTLTQAHQLVLTWGQPIEEPLAPMCERFRQLTVAHWNRWVKQCNIPPRYQHEVIRSALALKLHCFEDTGAIVAATTTSIPEAPKSGRTWDYRYCWLRDAYYVVDAFRLLGHFDEREQFINYLLNIVGGQADLALAPLYSVTGQRPVEEHIATGWAGFNGDGPVRVGNAAMGHQQNDIFGELVLALVPIFFDERFGAERTPATLDLLMRLATRAVAVAGTPDTGIWEFRTAPTAQTFSSLMCWAAADRAAAVAQRYQPDREAEFREAAARIQQEIATRAYSTERQALVGRYDGTDLDASLLQMAPLRLFGPDDPRLRGTVDRISQELSNGGWLMRYREDDGLGTPSVAFMLCTFWLIEAFATLGRMSEARELMDSVVRSLGPLGLLAEDFDPASGRMTGNFPQAYSHVGFIRAAFAAAPKWSDVL
ncbi:MAG: glycoside hydrolase family 15 protein [Acidobacteria bacterium]|nr:MAG: glycoside hydrolase family 15 protein [Acidobacteriota bacterium]